MCIICWSSDLDRVWPVLILSTTGAASGMEVDIFFTFWGLRVLQKNDKRVTGKNWMQKGESIVDHGGTDHLKLGKINFAGAGTAMIKVEKKGDTYAVSELFKNPDFGAHTQPPVLHNGHFYSHYTINERSDGLVAMSMDGQVKWKTDQQPPFVRGGSILADGLLLMTDGNTKLYLVEPSPAGFKPLASAVILEPGDNWAPLALADGKLLVRGQKELKALQVAQ